MDRRLGVVVATCTAVASMGQAGQACAHPSSKAAKAALARAAFVDPAAATPAAPSLKLNSGGQFSARADDGAGFAPAYSATTLGVRDERVSAAVGGPFAFPAYTGTTLDPIRLSQTDRLIDGSGLARWRTTEVTLGDGSDGAVDSLRMSVGGVARGAGGLVLARPDSLLDPDAEAFDVTYTRGWPSALKFKTGDYALDVSPHAGVGMSNAGGSAEAGAMIQFGQDVDSRVRERLNGLGIKTVDGSSFGNRGRWYLFAAASGRAVGLNMLRDSQGDFRRANWSTDPASALIGDAQAGVGWRKGAMQASFGYLHREIKPSSSASLKGMDNRDDDMVAFSLSFKPRR